LVTPIGVIEQGLLLIIWLIQVIGLFSPWELFVNPQGDTQLQSSGESRPIFWILSSFVVFLSLMRWKVVLRTLWLAWPFLILCSWILLSMCWMADPGKSGVGRFMIIVIFSAYVASRYDSLQFVRFLTRGFAIAVLASAAVMVLAPNLGFSNLAGDYAYAWRGAFSHKNALGAAMSFGIVVSGYSYVVRANHRLLSAFTCIGCLLLLVLSRSATSLIATIASALVAVIGGAVQSQRAPVLRAIALIGVGIAIIILIMWPLLDINLNELPSVVGRSTTLTGRTEVWRAVWTAIQERPLIGHGYGFWEQPSVTKSNIWLAVNDKVPHAHNNWLDTGLQLGLVGVLVTAFIWLFALQRGIWLVFVKYGHGALLYLAILFNCLSRSFVETVTLPPILLGLFWWVTAYMYIGRCEHQRVMAAKTLPSDQARLGRPQPAGHNPVREVRT